MTFDMVAIDRDLHVEGTSELGEVGRFSGPVIAVAVRAGDPVSAAGGEAESSRGGGDEGMFGWGTTSFLVADADKPAPVWVAKSDIDAHRVGSG